MICRNCNSYQIQSVHSIIEPRPTFLSSELSSRYKLTVMKNFSLSILLSFIATAVFSQKNADFGLVLQAGNFTSPNQKTEQNFSGGEGVYTNSTNQKAGISYAVGIRQSIRLGGYFRISAEVLYRMASFSTSKAYSYGPISAAPNYTDIQSQQVAESSIAIPVKLHMSLKKNGRTSIVLGAGISRVLRSEFKANSASKNVLFPQSDYACRCPDLDLGMRDFKPATVFTAGLYQNINKSTSLGLEFSYEHRSEEQRYSSGFGDINEPFVNCFCSGYQYLQTPSMRSLSVSLSHNLSK